MWRSGLGNGIGDCYHAEMAKNPPPRRRKASTAGPFFDLLIQMEALAMSADLDWPDDIRADAQRRLNDLLARYGMVQRPARDLTFDELGRRQPCGRERQHIVPDDQPTLRGRVGTRRLKVRHLPISDLGGFRQIVEG
jgi:hypothetical protein